MVLLIAAGACSCAMPSYDEPMPDLPGSPGVKETDAPATAAPDGTDEYISDGLPEKLSLFGAEIRFLCSSDPGKSEEISAYELMSEVVNDSVFNRERFVEDRLDAEITVTRSKDPAAEIAKQVSADENTYSAYCLSASMLSALVFDNALTDLYTLEFIDTDMPWWSDKFNSEAEVDGSLYLTTGSLSLSLLRNLYAVFFNKNLTADYSDSYPELADLYETALGGNWTFDLFSRLGGVIYTDLNGDTYRDEEDLYGIGFQNGGSVDAFWSGFDLNILSPTSDGWFEPDINTDKLFRALDMMYSVLHTATGSVLADPEDANIDELVYKFSSDSLLFMCNRLQCAEGFVLRSMPSDYGVLPFPKFDSRQSEYLSYALDSYTAFAIPKANDEPDDAAAVLEAMASYSYRDTLPSYLDKALKGKYMSDPQSRKTVDLVVNGFSVDTAWIFVDTLGGGYPKAFRDLLVSGGTTFSSENEKALSKMEQDLASYRVAAEEMELG